MYVYMNGYMYMYESLHWSPKTITTSLIGYTPIQNKRFKKKNTRLYSDSDSLGLDGAQAPGFSTIFPQTIQKYGHA